MDDAVGLINMNARIYDPLLGRFMSADPKIPKATMTQSWNRYAYVYNNPLSYTDPTGYSGWGNAPDDGTRGGQISNSDYSKMSGADRSDYRDKIERERRERAEAAKKEKEEKERKEKEETLKKQQEEERQKLEEQKRQQELEKQKKAEEEAKLKAEVEAILDKVKNNPLNDSDFTETMNSSDFDVTPTIGKVNGRDVLGRNFDVCDNLEDPSDNDISIASEPHDLNKNGSIDPGVETIGVVDTIAHEVNHDRVDETGRYMDSGGYPSSDGHPPSHNRETREHINKYGEHYGF